MADKAAIHSDECAIFLYGEGTSQQAVVTCMVKVEKAILGLSGPFTCDALCSIRPGHCVEVKGFIPHGCKRFNINLGKNNNSNIVIHFDARFDHLGDKGKIVMNSVKDGVFGNEQKEGFFPFQMGSHTKVCFTFEKDKILIQLPAGSPLSFPIRFPITEIT